MKKRWLTFYTLSATLLAMALWGIRTFETRDHPRIDFEYNNWTEETTRAASGIPVRNGDRVKPFSTYARVLLLGFHGNSTITFIDKKDNKHKINATNFLLDVLLRPEVAKKYPVFQVENAEILNGVGMQTKKVSDHYSYEALEPYINKILSNAFEYHQKEQKSNDLEANQKQLIALAVNIIHYKTLCSHLNFARYDIAYPANPDSEDSSFEYVATSDFMRDAVEWQKMTNQKKDQIESLNLYFKTILSQVLGHPDFIKKGPILLQTKGAESEWMTAHEAIEGVVLGNNSEPKFSIRFIEELEKLYDYFLEYGTSMAPSLEKISSILTSRLNQQERKDLALEISHNKSNWFVKSIFFCFLPGMLFTTLSWLNLKGKWGKTMTFLTITFTTVGLAFTVIGITQRSLIMHRPPVGNLYDTIIFIAAGVVLIALISELMTRRKIAIGIAPFIGFFLLVLSWIYEREEGVDNLEPLIAVLRSNFWLTIHVPTITFGYSAGLAAWIFGSVYIFIRILGLDKDDPSLRKLLTRMTYGSIGFCLLLSLIGTVTGGIWANDSWGRFWGWDPKENGALLIVLWCLFILHARLGGIIKEWGIHLCAICTGPIVVFSWWHVNLLGVGLHSYGFSDSKVGAVNLFYIVNLALIILGFSTAFFKKRSRFKSNLSPSEM